MSREPMDYGDIAADYQSCHNRAALAHHRRVASMGQALPGSDICGECGETIPPGRRKALPCCRLCVECAGVNERLKGGL